MNYEEMSDKEINKLVSGYISNNKSNGAIMVRIKYGVAIAAGEDDYCNKWGCMGPIINEYGISLLQQDNSEGWCAFRWDNDDAQSWNKNPLRAAAIVFLMMKDAEKAN